MRQGRKHYTLKNYSLTMRILFDLLMVDTVRRNSLPKRCLTPIGRVGHEELVNLTLPFTILRVEDLKEPVNPKHRHQYIVTDQEVIHNPQAIVSLRQIISDMQDDAMFNINRYIDEVEKETPNHKNPYHLGTDDWEYRGARPKTELNRTIKLLREAREKNKETFLRIHIQDAWHYCLVSRMPNGLTHLPEFYWQQEGLPLHMAFYDDDGLYDKLHLEGLITDLGYINYNYGQYQITPEEHLEAYHQGGIWELDPPEY